MTSRIALTCDQLDIRKLGRRTGLSDFSDYYLVASCISGPVKLGVLYTIVNRASLPNGIVVLDPSGAFGSPRSWLHG